jgi:hypothetical protein
VLLRPTTGRIHFSAVETLTVNTAQGGNLINVPATVAAINTTIAGGAGADDINLYATGARSNVVISGAHGADDIHVLNTGRGSFTLLNAGLDADRLTLENTGPGGAHVDLLGHLGDDTIDVLGTAASSVTYARGSHDNDTINVGGTPAQGGDLATIAGSLAIHGGGTPAGSRDTVHYWDDGDSGLTEYELADDGDLTRTGVTPVDAAHVELVTLAAGSAANTIDLTTSTTVEFFIDGNDPTAGPPEDVLTVNLAGATGMVFIPGGLGAGSYSFSNREDITFVEIESFPIPLTGAVAGSSPAAADAGLPPETLAAVADAAAWQWESSLTGVTLPEIAISVADLPGRTLALASGDSIIVDADAAGIGWFVDDTPWDNVEFASVSGRRSLTAKPNSAAAGKYDLVSAIAHEYGHLLGYGHTDECDRLMSESLVRGERRLPDASWLDDDLLDTLAKRLAAWDSF